MGERFGGQVLDTVDIENYISVPKTEGQKLAGALKAHVNDYNVDVIDSQSATKLTPAATEGGLHQIETPPARCSRRVASSSPPGRNGAI